MSTLGEELSRLIPNEGLVLIAGGIGSGKSCLGYSILEHLHATEPSRSIFVFNFPAAKASLLPDYITTIYSVEFPEGSIVLIDEAYLTFYSKDHANSINRFMDKFAGLVRQKNILAIFITQTTRKLVLATMSSIQLALLKCPDIMMTKFDRAELRKLWTLVLRAFRPLSSEKRQRSTYVISLDYEGFVQESNSQPSFWNDGLSRVWRDVSLAVADVPTVIAKDEKPEIEVFLCTSCGRFAYMLDGKCEYCNTKREPAD